MEISVVGVTLVTLDVDCGWGLSLEQQSGPRPSTFHAENDV